MITPFVSDDLFEINNNAEINYDSVNEVIYIDNVFLNYDDILDLIYNIKVESWKKSHNSRNFIDYYDCRLSYNNVNSYKKDNQLLYDLINTYFNINNKELFFRNAYTFNYFKNNIKGLTNKYQFYPHYDNAFNIIFYLDNICNGGTAIYENVDNWINQEEHNLFYNVEKLKIKNIIQSNPNRASIFAGNRLHGGYIDKHDIYYYNWRINMVNFVKEGL